MLIHKYQLERVKVILISDYEHELATLSYASFVGSIEPPIDYVVALHIQQTISYVFTRTYNIGKSYPKKI